jgi:hypothetical protein
MLEVVANYSCLQFISIMYKLIIMIAVTVLEGKANTRIFV